jgi:hypothetical protein
MGRQRGKLGSWQCGPVGRHMLTTSQGNDSQNETSASAGCYEAPTDFGCRFSGNSPNEIAIAIAGTHEVDINAS